VVAAGAACSRGTTTPTPVLAIQCAAVPSGGAAPLSVAFVLDVQNASGPLAFGISYGDGAQGNDPDVRHVYSAAGEYVASFTLSSGNRAARCSIPISVAPPSPVSPVENGWPNASFRTTPSAVGATITGKASLTVHFNMCQSSDPEGDPLYFRMDLDGDGTYELFGPTGADCRHEAVYAAGTRTVTLCVTDFDCPADAAWCPDLPRYRVHPYQCQSYTVVATP
jgi:PKD repeat protein